MKDINKELPTKYPEAWEKYNNEIDRLFPKGDKRRGDALVLGSMIFIAMDNLLTKQVEEAYRKGAVDFVLFCTKRSKHFEFEPYYLLELLSQFKKQYLTNLKRKVINE